MWFINFSGSNSCLAPCRHNACQCIYGLLDANVLTKETRSLVLILLFSIESVSGHCI